MTRTMEHRPETLPNTATSPDNLTDTRTEENTVLICEALRIASGELDRVAREQERIWPASRMAEHNRMMAEQMGDLLEALSTR